MRMGSLPADNRRMTTGRELLDAARAARKREAPGLDDVRVPWSGGVWVAGVAP